MLGGDNCSADDGGNLQCAEPQSGLWFDLWKLGKPTGWGGPWWEDEVEANAPSDPYLMTGFDQKCLHISQQSSENVEFSIEIDFQGDGHFHRYATLEVAPNGYAQHTFPNGFSAHWVRLVANRDTVATAQFFYT